MTDCEKCKQWAAFISILILNCADVLTDWLFFASLISLKTGLVYGPESDGIVWSVLGFAAVGTILFSVEVVNMFRKLRGKSAVLENQHLLSAIGVWFADVPMMILNVIVAACREELVNNVQLVKVVVILVGAIIRFIIFMVIVRCCCDRGNLKRGNHKTSKVCVAVGMVVTLICSTLIFVFSLYHNNGNQRLPNDSNTYFENVGIFVNQDFILGRHEIREQRWMKIADMQKLMKAERDLIFKYRVEYTENSTFMITAHNAFEKYLSFQSCSKLTADKHFKHSLPVSACKTPQTLTDIHTTVFRFTFAKPERGIISNPMIFGDISFNVKKRMPGGRLEEGSRETMVRYFGFQISDHYFSMGTFPQAELKDIKDIWKTGYCHCKPTGHDTPIENRELTIDDDYFND